MTGEKKNKIRKESKEEDQTGEKKNKIRKDRSAENRTLMIRAGQSMAGK